MLKMVVKPPVQFSHLVTRLPMIGQMKEPIRAMAINRMDEERRVKLCSGSVLDVAVQPVLDQVAPAVSVLEVEQCLHIFAIELKAEHGFGFCTLVGEKIDQGIDGESQQNFGIFDLAQDRADSLEADVAPAILIQKEERPLRCTLALDA